MASLRPPLSPVRRFLLGTGRVSCVLIVLFWAASYRWSLCYEAPGWTTFLVGSGFVRYGGISRAAEGIPPPPGWRIGPAVGFGGGWVPVILPPVYHVPFWCLLVGAALATARVWWRPRSWLATGYCISCGYNLAGLAADAPCPECGFGRLAPGA